MSDRTEDLLDEIVRLMVASLRKDLESQAEAIALLTEAGFASNRIAELVGTTVATVRTAQDRLKKDKSHKGKPRA
jgi:predicted transcriptional regulator